MLTAFTFPGQGDQYPGMLQLWPEHCVVQQTLLQVEAVLGQKLLTLDSQLALQDTRNVQLSLLISGVVWGRYLQARGCDPDFVLGMSIGAYPAAVVAGSLDFADAIRLVDIRGRLMQQAFPEGYGMIAISGASREQIEAVVARQQQQRRQVYLANLNAQYQFVLAGAKAALKETAEILCRQGNNTSQLLEVTVPSHSPLFKPQAEQLRQAFAKITINTPTCRYVSAARARVLYQSEAIREDLAINMSTRVHWHDSSQMLAERGVQRLIEMPPGATLTQLIQRVLPNGHCFAVSNTRLDTLLYHSLNRVSPHS